MLSNKRKRMCSINQLLRIALRVYYLQLRHLSSNKRTSLSLNHTCGYLHMCVHVTICISPPLLSLSRFPCFRCESQSTHTQANQDINKLPQIRLKRAVGVLSFPTSSKNTTRRSCSHKKGMYARRIRNNEHNGVHFTNLTGEYPDLGDDHDLEDQYKSCTNCSSISSARCLIIN